VRVLLVSHRYPPDGISGVERYSQTLAEDLAKSGHTVSVVTRRPLITPQEPRLVRERAAHGITIFRAVGGIIGLDRFLDHHERLEEIFDAVMIESDPDVVHFNHLRDWPPQVVEIAHQNAAVVLSLHDFYFACPLIHLQKLSGELCDGPDGGRECARTCFKGEGEAASLRWGTRAAYFRRLLALADRIVTPSPYVANYFERFGAGPERIRIVPNGIQIADEARVDVREPSPRRQGPLKLAFLGTVTSHKGVHVILDALRLADLDSVDVAVLGGIADQGYVRELRARAKSVPGLEIHFYGGYELDELSYLLQDIDVVIIPSLVPETFSITTREALVRGIPVIVSTLGALPEAVTDGENGLTFDATRPSELAGILQRLSEDRNLLPRLRQGALRSNVVTIAEHALRIQVVYREALQNFEGPRVARESDIAELTFLRSALLQLGFGPLAAT
jgi:glycosyltransferase involved in cell wall biosynthesis